MCIYLYCCILLASHGTIYFSNMFKIHFLLQRGFFKQKHLKNSIVSDKQTDKQTKLT